MENKERLKVIFRRDKDGEEIIAFFPELPAYYGDIVSYTHVGQHCEASYRYYIYDTVKATYDEYKPLLEELNQIYDNNLEVRQRLYYDDLLNKAWNGEV